MSKIKTIYLDMDGVLCDFRKGCEALDAIKGHQVDWKTVKAQKEKFWAELPSEPGAEKVLEIVEKICKENNIDLCILSAVTYEDGVKGKNIWLNNNSNIPSQNRYFVAKGNQKFKYATNDSLLIDDYAKNIEEFIMAGGKGIVYRGNPEDLKADILENI